MIHGTLVLTVLQHGDLDRVRLAHHGAVHGGAARARVLALDVQAEDVHDGVTAQKRDLAVQALEPS